MSAETKGYIDGVLDRLQRRVKPAGLIAHIAGGKSQPLSLGERRGRWERIRRFLELNDWVRLDCYSDPDCKVYLDAVENEEGIAPEPEDEGPVDDPLAQVNKLFNSAAAHVDRMVAHIRRADADVQQCQTVFIQTLTSRNAELEALSSEALAALREAAVIVRGQDETDLSPKDRALLAAIDGIGQKLLGLPPMGMIQQLPPGRANGSGAATAPDGGGEV